jgi:superfamily II DNA or RNA helicase
MVYRKNNDQTLQEKSQKECKMIPRDYQVRAVTKVRDALLKHGNTVWTAATGAGKSLMMAMLIKEMKPQKTLVLQHRTELLDQNIQKLRRVVPNASVSLYTADVKSWRGAIVFGTTQTLSRPANLKSIPKLDLYLLDEVHHAVSPSNLAIIDAIKNKNPDCMIAGCTATIMRGDGKELRKIFNNIADVVTIKELVQRGFLVPPRAFVVEIAGIKEGLSKVRKLSSDFDLEQAAQVLNKVPVNEEVVRKWKEIVENRRTVIFCATVVHAEDVRDAFLKEGISAETITGAMNQRERAGVYKRLKSGETRVVTNVFVLTEGWDAPEISCVIMLRPCMFKSVLIQCVGRGLRSVNAEEHPGIIKKDCIIIDFGRSIIEHGNIDSDVSLGRKESEKEQALNEAPFKICPDENQRETPYNRPDIHGNYGCGATVPVGVKTCPLCGFTFARIDERDDETLQEVVLTEIDLLNSSPFRWVDLFGSGKVMLASGFEAWSGVFSPDGENWYALGKAKASKLLHKLMIGDRTQALAAADDFLRTNETTNSAQKSKRWLKDVASDKQKELLRKLGYEVGDYDYSFTKYSAANHLNFQWNRRQIEAVILAR